MTRAEQKKFIQQQIRDLFNQECELNKRRKQLEQQLEQMQDEDAIKRAKGE